MPYAEVSKRKMKDQELYMPDEEVQNGSGSGEKEEKKPETTT